MFSFRTITSSASDTIGDSLSAVNDAYNQLDLATTQIELSCNQLWKPFNEFYIENQSKWKSAVHTIQTLSSDWISFQTTVQNNSAQWLEPLTVIYPYSFPDYILSENLVEIVDWFNETFPVIPLSATAPGYIEGQKAIVYSLTYYTTIAINETTILKDTAECTTFNQTWKGLIQCQYFTICAKGSSVNKNSSYDVILNCYVPANQTKKTSEKTLNVYFNNWYENRNLNALYLKVQNCKWEIEKFL